MQNVMCRERLEGRGKETLEIPRGSVVMLKAKRG